ncbi:MAG TPA: dynamin family protein [Natronosporangium sp.]|nr:dynamin family protein [Natronosporangium sp.]
MNLIDETRALLADAHDLYRGTPQAAHLDVLAARLEQPLRIAVAGRVKAGKSTLLNALIGDRLAPTDAGECTRIVTWYQDGHTYRVLAHPATGGTARQLRFHRDGGALHIDLGDLAPDTVSHLEVTWPSRALRTATMIDTPGIGSLSDRTSARTWDTLAPDTEDDTPADAVIYLMRHLHRDDLDFLHAFHDTEVSRPNPVNAIAVLSRADEIGVGRLDAMASARRIAHRMATDPQVRRLVQTVIPVAGLLAETAATLTETEHTHLRALAQLTPADANALLLTADRALQGLPDLGLTPEQAGSLLARFGLFGLRLATTLLRHNVATTATQLAAELAERSGINQLREILQTLFFQRRDILKSRSVLSALDTLVRTHPRPGGDRIAARVEQVIASAHPFNELRILSAVRAGWITGKPEVLDELERLIGGEGDEIHRRLHLPPDTDTATLTKAASQALSTWQRRAENPLTSHELALAARVAVRTCEGMLVRLRAER